jgi:hypothetical protein
MLHRFPQQVKPGDDVISETVQNEVVLLKLSSQEYFGLGDVGAHAWKLLVETGDVARVADRLCESYAGDPTRIRSDFQALVDELIEAGLLKAADHV